MFGTLDMTENNIRANRFFGPPAVFIHNILFRLNELWNIILEIVNRRREVLIAEKVTSIVGCYNNHFSNMGYPFRIASVVVNLVEYRSTTQHLLTEDPILVPLFDQQEEWIQVRQDMCITLIQNIKKTLLQMNDPVLLDIFRNN